MKYSFLVILAIFSLANALFAVEGIDLSDEIVRNNWDLVQRSLNQQKVIMIWKETLSEDSLHRILSL